MADRLRLRAGVVHRARRDPEGLAAAVHAADVADQRDLGHCGGGIDPGDRRRLPDADPPPRRDRPLRFDDQHRQRVSHHRSHAEDVQDRQARRGQPDMMYGVSQLGYLVASALFIFALHWMNTPTTARKGVYAGVAGTAMAVVVTWADPSVIHHLWIILAIVAGFIVGVPLSRVPLTAVPQRTALSHAFGGAAAGLVGTAEFYLRLSEGAEALSPFRMVALIAEVLLGYLTLTGSLMAAGKLQELKWVPQRPVTYPFTNVLFGAFGQVKQTKATGEEQVYKSETPEGAAQVLEQANLVVIIPGYGMAVAQAQHKVRELYDQLKKRGITVKFAIHPVAGRMPGHMNVL